MSLHTCTFLSILVFAQVVTHADTPDTYHVVATVQTQKSARTMALNPADQRSHLVAAEFGPAPAASAEQPRPRPPLIDGSFSILVVAPPQGRNTLRSKRW